MFDPTTRLACATRVICGVPGMTFHGNMIALGNYTITMINIKKWFVKLPFPNPDTTKVNNMGNGIVYWWEKGLIQVL
jgi:hypothetical protein